LGASRPLGKVGTQVALGVGNGEHAGNVRHTQTRIRRKSCSKIAYHGQSGDFYMQLSDVKLGSCRTHTSLADKRPVQVIAVTGGKGGTGKTNIAVNLSLALAANGYRTLLLDADLGMANVDVLLGLEAHSTFLDVLNGVCQLEDIILDGTDNLLVIPAASGLRQLANLGMNECAGLVRAFSDLKVPVDTLVIDTATGISEAVTSFCSAATEILVVVCNEPAFKRQCGADQNVVL